SSDQLSELPSIMERVLDKKLTEFLTAIKDEASVSTSKTPSKQVESLDPEARGYVSQSDLDPISERIVETRLFDEVKEESRLLKSELSTRLAQMEELKRDLGFRKQEVSSLRAIIAEGEDDSSASQKELEEVKQMLSEAKTLINDLEQQVMDVNHQLELLEEKIRESASIGEKYKQELIQLREVLSGRKEEVRNLAMEGEKLKNEVTRFGRIEMFVNEIIRKGEALGLESGATDVEKFLKDFSYAIDVWSRIYFQKGHVKVLKFLKNNLGWQNRNQLAKKLEINPGLLNLILSELREAKLVQYDEDSEQTKIIDTPTDDSAG
ncbi:MAG TPA: hypothetical protein VJ044_03985, partial [Candidatus Hodarchaeales archaeon]|nr:hypothetical protein [Candidatus Hodarchaeales archaeon]